MATEQKDNSGALFKNDKKGAENHPDYRGNIRVDGRDYWISAWLKTAQSGVKYMSLAVTDKEKQTKPAPKQEKKTEYMEDDIPF